MILNTGRQRFIAGLLLMFFFIEVNQCQAAAQYKRKIEKYNVPDVTLVNQDGKRVNLKEHLNLGKPVILDFIYATCTTICPVLSIGFSHFQKKLGPEAEKVQLVSISIDPDNDTPAAMKEYLQKYDAQDGWDFFTGNRDDIITVMKAFDSYVINKMNHYPVTILRAPGKDEWVRINELLSTSDLMDEYKLLQKKSD